MESSSRTGRPSSSRVWARPSPLLPARPLAAGGTKSPVTASSGVEAVPPLLEVVQRGIVHIHSDLVVLYTTRPHRDLRQPRLPTFVSHTHPEAMARALTTGAKVLDL